MSNNNKDFYVGYLQMPAGLKSFYKGLVALLIFVSIAFAYWVSSSQKLAGHGEWDLSQQKTYHGYLSHKPYAVLHTIGDNPETVMLALRGKHSSTKLTMPFDGDEVRITGFPIERGGWKMLELRDSSDIDVVSKNGNSNVVVEPLGEVTLSGEIIDSKCFLGVMKPGAGKVHRACAAMCIAGGMPPMMVVQQTNGDRYGYILVDADGSSAADIVLNDVAVPVSVFGRLERRGDLTYLHITKDGIKRI